ncbi:ABC transporter permease [Pontibacillus sp. ALD_SL1]|uniref:ABC transporter permease n=1 Tax=Pontibacillus sp. ALD_SL1 TaxID=2777185 RepID=UPI001A964984|nr:ABC transporter permease [Pontibacillus sp. ALD_SL1]QST01699.1 ABC transporter permease [Pontibacillus sp. ALD_SL1]
MKALLWARLKSLRKQKAILITMFILPIVFTFFFSMSGSGSAYSVGVVTEDEHEDTQEWLNKLSNQDRLMISEINRNDLEEDLSEGVYDAIVVVAKDSFKESSQDISITIYRTVDTSNIQVIEQAVREVSLHFSNEKRITENILSTIPDADIYEEQVQDYVNSQLEDSKFFQVNKNAINQEEEVVYNATFQALVGFTLFFTMYTIIFSLGEMIEDRQKGIMTRLRLSPISSLQLYSANFLYSFLIGFIQVFLLIIIGQYVFGIDWGGRVVSIGVILALYVFATMAYGMLLCSFSDTMQQLSAITPVVAVSFAMLGGAYWPIEIVQNDILLALANITPIYHAMNALKGVVLYDHSLIYTSPSLLNLVGMSVVLLTIGIFGYVKRFR